MVINGGGLLGWLAMRILFDRRYVQRWLWFLHIVLILTQ